MSAAALLAALAVAGQMAAGGLSVREQAQAWLVQADVQVYPADPSSPPLVLAVGPRPAEELWQAIAETIACEGRRGEVLVYLLEMAKHGEYGFLIPTDFFHATVACP